ncbi:MAG: hypothetical protein RR324_03645 [Cellulosilyticaceae bacterium]
MLELKGKSLISLHNYSKEKIEYLVELANDLKTKKKIGILGDQLRKS